MKGLLRMKSESTRLRRKVDDIDFTACKVIDLKRFVRSKDLKPRTMRRYCRYLMHFEKWSGIESLDDITMNRIQSYSEIDPTSLRMHKDKVKERSEEELIDYVNRKRAMTIFALKKYYEVIEVDFEHINKKFKRIKGRFPQHNPVEFSMSEESLEGFLNCVKYKYSKKMPNELTDKERKMHPNNKIITVKEDMLELEIEKMKLFIKLLYYVGCRASELLLTLKSDVGWKAHPTPLKIPKYITKSSERRTVFIKKDLAIELKSYLSKVNLKDDDYIFWFNEDKYPDEDDSSKQKKNVRKSKNIRLLINEIIWIDSVFKKYADEPESPLSGDDAAVLSCHKLRHAYAQWLQSCGFTLTKIQAMMGHSKVELTATYLKVKETELADDFERMVDSKIKINKK